MNKAIANRKEQNLESSEEWPKINWSDFCEVARATPIVVKGAFGFGLKAIVKNLKKHGLTQTEWGDGPADGLGAMVGGWYCDKQVEGTDKSMMSINYMKEIEEYNKVDCKVMWELVNYLRKHHS